MERILVSAHHKNVKVELPKIANKFEERTIKGSRVTPKTAGIESTCEHKRLQ